MKFKVLKTFKASLDGFNLASFKEGEILEKNDLRLTKHFLDWASANKGFIEEIKEQKMFPEIDNKAIVSYENKTIEQPVKEEAKKEIINNKKKNRK